MEFFWSLCEGFEENIDWSQRGSKKGFLKLKNEIMENKQKTRLERLLAHIYPSSLSTNKKKQEQQKGLPKFETKNHNVNENKSTKKRISNLLLSNITSILPLLIKLLLPSLSDNNNTKHLGYSKVVTQSSQTNNNPKQSEKQQTTKKPKQKVNYDPTSHPNPIDKIIRSFQGSGALSTDSIQAFNNILFLVNSIPPSMNSLSIFDIMLRSSKRDSDLLPFLAQVKIPKSALGGTDYKTFITTLSKVKVYLPNWYYNALVLAKALNNFDSILLFCAQRFSREIKIQKAITGALIYPAIMSVIGFIGIILLLTKILPQNISIFESMGLTVPSFLQYTNYLVRCVQYHWLALFYIIPSTISMEYLPFRTFLKYQYMKMHTPLGNLQFLQDKSTLLHMLSLLDKEQITSKLLLVCSNISTNPVLQHMVEGMASLTKYGASADEVFAYMLKQKHIFSPYEIAYLQACFMSGKHSIIQDGLKYVSQMVLKQYMQQLSTLLKILNPATIAIIGVLVIIIAILGIYPMIALTSAVSANK